MIDITDRHCRAWLRLFSRQARLYTGMVVTASLMHGERERLLGFDQIEHPVALQLGGNNPKALALCASLAEHRGYDEVNLNVGCPSERVKKGMFGACLMAQPELVADCVAAMVAAVKIPITVKTRIGIDDRDSYQQLQHFIRVNAEAGCKHFIVHARKAWLKGLSPRQNRNIPPLDYARVYQLQKDFPALRFCLNGGVTSLEQAAQHYRQVDGVMIGRQAYHDPWMLTQVDTRLLANTHADLPTSRLDAVERYLPYVERQLAKGVDLRHMTRHLLSLFLGQAGARNWRRYLSEHSTAKGAGIEVIKQALKFVAPANFAEPQPDNNPKTCLNPISAITNYAQ